MPPHHHRFTPYPPPNHDDLAALLGDEWADILTRVLEQAPSEQAGLADLIVCSFVELADRLARIESLLVQHERVDAHGPEAPA